MKFLIALTTMLFATVASAVPPSLYLKNQFGEVSNNYVTGGTFTTKLPTTMLLTGFVAGSGTVSATDTVLVGINKIVGNANSLQAKGLIPGTVEAIIAAGAVSATVMETTVSNVTAGTYAITLAAPSSQDGQIKIIKAVATMTHTVTLALTNVSMGGAWTPTGTTTLTFTSAGDSAVFIAIGSKWVYLGGSAVAS
jgi:hypothetical protein